MISDDDLKIEKERELEAAKGFLSVTHKFSFPGYNGGEGVDFYFTVGHDEMLIHYMSLRITDDTYKSLILLIDMATLALQKGAVLRDIVDALKTHEYEPNGCTSSEAIPIVKSVPDYIGRWLEMRFLAEEKDKP